MKKILFLTLVTIVLASCSQKPKNNTQITGNIAGLDATEVYLMEREGRDFLVYDTAAIENGIFTFSLNTEMPEMRYLATDPARPFTDLFVEPGNITVNSNGEEMNEIVVAGTKNNDLYTSYKTKDNEINTRLYAVYDKYKQAKKEGNEDLALTFEKELDAIDKEQNDATLAFIKNNTNAVVSSFLMWRYSYMFELEDMEPVYGTMSEEVKRSEYAQHVKERIDLLNSIAPGQPFIDFSMEDTKGNMVALSEMTGKVTLVDFWASWCSPCRAENPNVVEAYKKYHKQGFDIVGVSFDRDHGKWLEAIKEDNLTWHHVSDLSYWDNAAGKLYGIRSIPSSFLMDENGIILAWNLRGEDLHNKLEEIFN